MANYDEATRFAQDALLNFDGPQTCTCDDCYYRRAQDVVTALVAAGWGDLAAERDRLTPYELLVSSDAPDPVRPAGRSHSFGKARLIRETPDRCPVCRHAPHASLGFCPNLASDNDCGCTVRETPEEAPEVWVDVPDDAPAYCNYPECDCPGGKVCAP